MDHIGLLKEKIDKPVDKFGELAIHYSDHCQLKCAFCKYNDRKKTLSVNNLKKAMEGSPISTVIVGGGEPTDLPAALFSSLSGLIPVNRSKLITNGVHFQELFEEDKAPYEHIRVSLDAANRETYHKTKGVDCFDMVLDNITRYLKTRTGIVCIDFVLTENSIVEIPELIQVAFERFFIKHPEKFYVQFKPLNSYFVFDINRPSKQSVENILRQIEAMEKDDIWMRYFIETHTNTSILNYSWQKETIFPMTEKCYASQIVSILSVDGGIYPCPDYMYKNDNPFGNISDTNLKTIFERQHSFFKDLKPQKHPICEHCSKKELNQFLEKMLHTKYNVANSRLSELAAFDTIDYFYTRRAPELLNKYRNVQENVYG